MLAPSGSQVAVCNVLAATVPPVTFAWYQRGVVKPLVALRTVCVVQSDSVPLMFVYWFRAIARMPRVSRLLAGVAAFGTI